MIPGLHDGAILGRPPHNLVRPLLPDHLAVVEGPIADVGDAESLLFPEEAEYVARAVDKRRTEFACGRLFARRAIASFAPADRPLLRGPDRAPLWPAGLIGSITHTDSYCAVAVAECARVAALGIDIEDTGRFKPELVRRILTPREIETNLRDAADPRATLMFSAKEALHKCLHPLTGATLRFHDAEVTLDPAANFFAVRIAVAAGPFAAGHTFAGTCAMTPERHAAAIVVFADGPTGSPSSGTRDWRSSL